MKCATFASLAAVMLLGAWPQTSDAQDAYPNKPIRVIVASSAGGTIGTEIAARAAPDGYTLTMGTTSTHVIAPVAYPKVKYDPVRDFDALTLVATIPHLLVLHPGVKSASLEDFVALAKSQPRKMNYASAGAGSITHLAMEMLKSAAGIDLVHVPYNGNGPAGAAVLGGQVQALFASMPAILPQAKSGKLRPIAVGTAKRSNALPDVPTVAESGYPGFEVSLWLGFFAPRGTPAPIIARLHGELVGIAQSAEMKEQFERNGAEPLTNITNLDLMRQVRSELGRYSKVIKDANIKLD